MKKLVFFFCVLFSFAAKAQTGSRDTSIFLTAHPQVRLESIGAMNDLYNFQFEKAEQQFRWLRQKYAWHPLPHFLMGLSYWWKLMPVGNNDEVEDKFLAYMDTAIVVGENVYEKSKEYRLEAAFFLAAAHGFKGHLYSEDSRKNWTLAAWHGKKALSYMRECSEKNYLSPELLFGDALYNYFSVWIPENYKILRFAFTFFKKGDKQLGLKQLKEVSTNAFYTRIEAMIWLMRIQNSYENNQTHAFQLADYLYHTFPCNPYFHRYYVRMLYARGMRDQLIPECKTLLQRIDSAKYGYEATAGRYASFFLGQHYQQMNQWEDAKKYYKRAIEFAKQNDSMESGYSIYSLICLGEISIRLGDKKSAELYFKEAKKYSSRSDDSYKEAKRKLKEMERKK